MKLTRSNIRVRANGELVEMELGNGVKVEMGPELAFQVAQLLRLHAKDAKRKAAIFSKLCSSLGILGDGLKRKDALDALTVDLRHIVKEL